MKGGAVSHETLGSRFSRRSLRWPALRDVVVDRARLLRLLPLARRRTAVGLVFSLLMAAGAAAASAPLTGWLVQSAASARRVSPLVTPLTVVVVLLVSRQFLEALADFFNVTAARQIDGRIRSRVRYLARSLPGIDHLADPEFRNDAMRASDVGVSLLARSPGKAATGQVVLLSRLVGAVASTVILARYFPALAVMLLCISLTLRAIVRRQWIHLAEIGDRRVGQQRQAEYWTELAASPGVAQEIRMFGLAAWIIDRRLRAHLEWIGPQLSARRSVLRRQTLTLVLAAGGSLALFLVPGIAAVQGRIGVGALTTSLIAGWSIFLVSFMGYEAFDIEYGLAGVRALDRLEGGYGRRLPVARGPRAQAPGSVPLIRFDEVTFTYPKSDRPVLRNLTLEIRPGEVVAVVGVNGAGKTTLAKLIAGLHRPSAGRLTVDGCDLTEMDLESWRRRVCVIFQDFVRYPTTVRDNIVLSAPDHVEPGRDGDRAIAAALRQADAEAFVASLPDGVDTRLWLGVAGGTGLSGGQWQKLAIARALFAVAHSRQLLVLDEPTAHLDAQAETEFFASVVQAVTGTSVILISHRLSTVRNADRIVVLDDGRIAESGSHEELMRRGGTYARLFRLQADRFVERRVPDKESMP